MSTTEAATEVSPFVWYELQTTDVTAATGFYSKVLPWTIADAGMPGMHYNILNVGHSAVGGLMANPHDSVDGTSAWIGYIGVKGIDAVAARLDKAGGKILKPVEAIPTVGSFAVAADPQGAGFVLFEPTPSGEQVQLPDATPGTFAWHDLTALDWQTDFAFYADLFGWQKGDPIEMGEFGIYQIFTINGEPKGGMLTRMHPDHAIEWLYYVNVADTEATIELVKANGGTLLMGPQVVPGGQIIAHFLDPQGAKFGVVAPPK